MNNLIQGNTYNIPIRAKEQGLDIDILDIEKVEVTIGQITKTYPNDVKYTDGVFFISLTEQDTMNTRVGLLDFQMRIVCKSGRIIANIVSQNFYMNRVLSSNLIGIGADTDFNPNEPIVVEMLGEADIVTKERLETELAKKQDKLSDKQIADINGIDNKANSVDLQAEIDNRKQADINLQGKINEKQSQLSEQQLFNIGDVQNKATKQELQGTETALNEKIANGNTNTLNSAKEFTTSQIQAVENKIPTDNTQLTNGANYITNAVNDLVNYYKKDEIDNKLSAIPKFSIKVVSELPTINISETTIYLLKSGVESQNLYTEYIYADNQWEKLGEQKVDLTGYATEVFVNEKINVETQARKDADVVLQNNINTEVENRKLADTELENKKFDKANVKNEHFNSQDTTYSTEQTNNEIIDSFKYNFRQEIKDSDLQKNLNIPNLTITNKVGGFSFNGQLPNRNTGLLFNNVVDIKQNHFYYCSANIIGDRKNLKVQFRFGENYPNVEIGGTIFNSAINTKMTNVYIQDRVNENVDITISPILVDLTEMFGAGNEPSTVEEVQQYLVKDKYYPYGRNIEPSMYVTKADVNTNMMGMPSDTIDILSFNPYLEKTFTANNNGYLILEFSPKEPCNFIVLSKNIIISSFYFGVINNTIRLSIAKGQTYTWKFNKELEFYDIPSARFIHLKEI